MYVKYTMFFTLLHHISRVIQGRENRTLPFVSGFVLFQTSWLSYTTNTQAVNFPHTENLQRLVLISVPLHAHTDINSLPPSLRRSLTLPKIQVPDHDECVFSLPLLEDVVYVLSQCSDPHFLSVRLSFMFSLQLQHFSSLPTGPLRSRCFCCCFVLI